MTGLVRRAMDFQPPTYPYSRSGNSAAGRPEGEKSDELGIHSDKQEDGYPMGGRPDRDRFADGRTRHAGGVNVAEHDPTRSGCLDRAAGVDGERLQPELRGAADY